MLRGFVGVVIGWFWVLWCGGFGLIVLGNCFPVVGSCVGDLVVGLVFWMLLCICCCLRGVVLQCLIAVVCGLFGGGFGC